MINRDILIYSTLIIAILAFILGYASYNRSGPDFENQIQDQIDQSLDKLENEIDTANMELNKRFALVEARMELLTIRSQLLVEQSYQEAAEDINSIRRRLNLDFQDSIGEVQDYYQELDSELEQIEFELRENSADAIGHINRMIIGMQTEVTPTKEDACVDTGGVWKEFSNSCADTCNYNRNKENIICALAIVESCDCGPDKCWNGITCEPIE